MTSCPLRKAISDVFGIVLLMPFSSEKTVVIAASKQISLAAAIIDKLAVTFSSP